MSIRLNGNAVNAVRINGSNCYQIRLNGTEVYNGKTWILISIGSNATNSQGATIPSGDIRVFLNTPQNVDVYVDGTFLRKVTSSSSNYILTVGQYTKGVMKTLSVGLYGGTVKSASVQLLSSSSGGNISLSGLYSVLEKDNYLS